MLFNSFKEARLRGNMESKKFFVGLFAVSAFLLHGVSVVDAEKVSVSVMEGDLVSLCTGVKTSQQDDIKWYFNTTLIARISGNLSVICTDVQCGDVNERFRDRLKLDHQTGSLTIRNIRITDTELYTVKIIRNRNNSNDSRDCGDIFNVTVHGFCAAERNEVKKICVKEGKSVTLKTDVIKKPNDVMKWYFNGIRIIVITGDQSKICRDVQCVERFRGRLKLDHRTGSLTITNIKKKNSGLYKLQINSYRLRIYRSFRVSVTDPDPAGKRGGRD